MMDLEFTFDKTPWETALEELPQGGSICAVRLLTLLEEESAEVLQDVLLELEIRGIALDISNLPKSAGTGEAALRLRQERELARSGDLLKGLEENDPLRLYLQEVEQLPAHGDPQKMAERFAGGYEAVLPGLTNRMLPTVIEMAREMTGYGVLLLDLIQEGSLGLWQGILSYRSGDFAEHARWWIRQYLTKAVTLQARQSGLGQRMKQAMEDYRAVDERLLTDLGRNPTIEEMAQELHMTVEEAETVRQLLENARMLQRAKGEAAQPEEDPEQEQHVEDTAYFQSRQRIEQMLSSLSETDARLLSLRFGLEGKAPLSPEETGRLLGLTAAEVVQREAAALAKLRAEG